VDLATKKLGSTICICLIPQQPILTGAIAGSVRLCLMRLRFWLDRGVDGFRVDVAGAMIKDEHLRDNPYRRDGNMEIPGLSAEAGSLL